MIERLPVIENLATNATVFAFSNSQSVYAFDRAKRCYGDQMTGIAIDGLIFALFILSSEGLEMLSRLSLMGCEGVLLRGMRS
jgi:hypothetical protein